MFLIEGSTSLGQSDFVLVNEGIAGLVALLDLNNGNTRVGAVSCGTSCLEKGMLPPV